MWMVRLWMGLPMIFCAWDSKKKIHFSFPVMIRCKNDFLLYRSSKISHVFLRLSICLLFNSCGTYLPTFWIFPISRRRLETACWLTLNCCELFLCLWIIFIQQCLQFHVFVLFGRFSVFFVCNIEISNFETLKPSFTRFLRWSMLSFSK